MFNTVVLSPFYDVPPSLRRKLYEAMCVVSEENVELLYSEHKHDAAQYCIAAKVCGVTLAYDAT
jgi:hypothetical protein